MTSPKPISDMWRLLLRSISFNLLRAFHLSYLLCDQREMLPYNFTRIMPRKMMPMPSH